MNMIQSMILIQNLQIEILKKINPDDYKDNVTIRQAISKLSYDWKEFTYLREKYRTGTMY